MAAGQITDASHQRVDDKVREGKARKYEWQYETPDRIIPPEEVRMIVVNLRKAFQALAKSHLRRLCKDDQVRLDSIEQDVPVEQVAKARMPSEEQLRQELVESSEIFREFSKSNQNKFTFDSICSYTLTTEDYRTLLQLCTLKEIVNEERISAENAQAIVDQHRRRSMIIHALTERSKNPDLADEEMRKVIVDLEAAVGTKDPLRVVCDRYRKGEI